MGSLEPQHTTPGSSSFSSLPAVDTDEIFNLLGAFRGDEHPRRVNLGAGIYCDDEGRSAPLSVVEKAERSMHLEQDRRRHDYLMIEGDARFLKVARDLVFGGSRSAKGFSTAGAADGHHNESSTRVTSVQTISGSGANHLGARFLAETTRPRCAWLSDPTWANHHAIWAGAGVPRRLYPYYDAATGAVDFAAMMSTLERDSWPGDVVVLHACAHNPTGADLSRDQWVAVADLCRRRALVPFFDTAYQGFASGDPDRDAWAMRYFYSMQPPLDMCVAQSFAKNFGLYGHRAGALHVVASSGSADLASRVEGCLSNMIRSEYSIPPRFGSDIVRTVLESDDLSKEWIGDLQVLSGRIRDMRTALYDELRRLGTPGSWDRVIKQVGMFTYTDLTPSEINILRTQFHIYMLSSGRISITGLNTSNVHYVAQAIHAVRTERLLQ